MSVSHIYRTKDFYRQEYLDEDDPILEQLAKFRTGLLENGYEPIPVRGKGRKGGLNNGWTTGEMTPHHSNGVAARARCCAITIERQSESSP